MGYSSQNQRRPFEYASKASHHHIINDADVRGLVERCWLPSEAAVVDLSKEVTPQKVVANKIEAIVAIDGGWHACFNEHPR